MRGALLVVRATGVVVLLLGLAIWAGLRSVLVPIHLLLGIVLVLALAVAAILSLRAGTARGLAFGAIAWGLLTALFGMNQASLMPGDAHGIVEIAHLGIGLVAIGLGEALGAASRRRGGTTGA